jgi:hypothetical protein
MPETPDGPIGKARVMCPNCSGLIEIDLTVTTSNQTEHTLELTLGAEFDHTCPPSGDGEPLPKPAAA